MRRLVFALAVVFFNHDAWAEMPQHPSVTDPPITVSPSINSISRSRATATGGQGGQGGAGGVGGIGQGGQSMSGASANPSAGASSGPSSVTFQTGNNSPFINQIPNDTTVRAAPLLYVPSVSTGNVCALGASAGGSWIAAAVAFGISWESMQCERRQAAALLWNMNTPESRAAAKEVICNTPEIRSAYARVGSPCAADMMHVAGAAAPQQPTAPTHVEPVAFNPAAYVKGSDCLTAASAQGAPLSLCAGKN